MAQDLSLIPVTTLDEVLEIISLGLKVRATHETKMNQVILRNYLVAFTKDCSFSESARFHRVGKSKEETLTLVYHMDGMISQGVETGKGAS